MFNFLIFSHTFKRVNLNKSGIHFFQKQDNPETLELCSECQCWAITTLYNENHQEKRQLTSSCDFCSLSKITHSNIFVCSFHCCYFSQHLIQKCFRRHLSIWLSSRYFALKLAPKQSAAPLNAHLAFKLNQEGGVRWSYLFKRSESCEVARMEAARCLSRQFLQAGRQRG